MVGQTLEEHTQHDLEVRLREHGTDAVMPTVAEDDMAGLAPAGGCCLRAPAKGACPYANICEHCPSFHTDATHLAVLAAQRVDAHDLAEDAERRGWIDEAERHRTLVSRLDALIAQAETA
ncbi:hypothetical protein MLGJGCBP_03532 [Rhodococcus sp. T7]|nr:hypothetical protein MLGJGCBP_03532 [Rhodococcus sp. T7]